MRVLFIDPGKATGWFCIDFGSLSWMGGEQPHDDFLDWLEPLPAATTNSPLVFWQLDRVVIEGFKIGPRTYQTNPTDAQLWSVKQIGAVEMWCRRLSIPFQVQMPLTKDFDKYGDKLRKMGWWKAMDGVKGEEGHRRAAARHALKWGIDHHIPAMEAVA